MVRARDGRPRTSAPNAAPLADPYATPLRPITPVYPQYGGPPGPGKQGMPAWGIVLIVLGSIFGVFVLLTLLAIPTFLAEQEREEETAAEQAEVADSEATTEFDAITYTLPDTVAGLSRMEPDDEAFLIEEWGLDTIPAFMANSQIGVYGTEDEPLVVSTGEFRAPASEVDQQSVRDNYLADWTTDGESLELTALDTGALGGYFGCAQDPIGHICLSTDARGLIEIWSTRTDADPEAIATEIRQSVITHGGAAGTQEPTT